MTQVANAAGSMMEQKTVLVVEDDRNIVELVKDTLGSTQYNILSANSASSALAILGTRNIDLVLMDITLSEDKTGFDICKEIKANKETSWIPVMIISAKDQMEDKLDAVDAGADDYMTKPFNPSELAKRVRLNMNLHFG